MKADVYYTQGEYVTYFDKDCIGMPLDQAADIREAALELAKEAEVKSRTKQGAGISRGRKTPTLPKVIWEKAYETLNT